MTFNFTCTPGGGSGTGYTFLWSTGSTASTTSFNAHAPAGDESDGTVSCTVHDSLGASGVGSASWFADGF